MFVLNSTNLLVVIHIFNVMSETLAIKIKKYVQVVTHHKKVEFVESSHFKRV